MNAIRFHVSKISQLVNSLSLGKAVILGALFPYYSATILNALLEGVSMLLLANIFTGGSAMDAENGLPAFIFDFMKYFGLNPQFPDVVPFLICILSVSLIIRLGLLSYNSYLEATLRRRIQEATFKHFLQGDWSYMRNFRAGEAVGTNTHEGLRTSKYLTSIIQGFYFFLNTLVILGLATSVSFKVSLILGVIALPLMWLMQKMVKMVAGFSKRCAVLRNEFSGDIADRFNGLLQIHVDETYDFHLHQGLKTQGRYTRLEVLTGFCMALIGSLNLLLPLTVLIVYFIWSFFMGAPSTVNLSLFAGVGVLGVRATSQLNGCLASFGNLARLSGSLYPVLSALSIPPRPLRQLIDEPIVRIEIEKASYAYGETLVIDEVSFAVEKGIPLVLIGRSGKGKTTLANLIAGLYLPSAGKLFYVNAPGVKFDSMTYHARVGFVTQDIYLFKGSLRQNLTAGRDRSDEQIWDALKRVDAAEFVRAMGGLDTESAEAGRSLSGGQRRRLGIARVLLSGSDILIFDEVTAGLDQINKTTVLNVIERLSKTYIVIIVSHEALSLHSQATYSV